MMNRQNAGCVGIAAIVALVLGIVSLFWAAESVDFGHVRAVTQYGELTGRILEPGLSWITPFVQGSVDYKTQIQTYETSDNPDESAADFTDFPINANTADGQQIIIKYTVRFHISADQVIKVATEVGKIESIVENIVKADSRNRGRLLAQNYQAEDLFSGIGIREYETAVENELRVAFEDAGVNLDDFLIRKIEFDTDYVQAIERQQIAQENIETAEYEAQAAAYERDRQITIAEAEAERLRLVASAQADNIRILADAEAYKVDIQGKALDRYPIVIQFEFVQKLSNIAWGILPTENLNYFLPEVPVE